MAKKRKYKRPKCKKERRKVNRYLRNHTATASMVAYATGIPLENVRWYKYDLECVGILWQVKKAKCQRTGYPAWYLSTKPIFNRESLMAQRFRK